MLSETLPEPVSDLNAQLRMLADKQHPRSAVFLSKHDDPAILEIPLHAYVAHRPEGYLVTMQAGLADWFKDATAVTDADLARILDYPQAKTAIPVADAPRVVQARDGAGHVVYEAGCSASGFEPTMQTAHAHTPSGGKVFVMSVFDALKRRMTTV